MEMEIEIDNCFNLESVYLNEIIEKFNLSLKKFISTLSLSINNAEIIENFKKIEIERQYMLKVSRLVYQKLHDYKMKNN